MCTMHSLHIYNLFHTFAVVVKALVPMIILTTFCDKCSMCVYKGDNTYALVSLPVREDFPDTLVFELSFAISASACD